VYWQLFVGAVSQEESLIPKATAEFATRRRPDFALPPNACDAHCHVIGPANVFPYTKGQMAELDAPKAMLAAFHRHIGAARTVFVQSFAHGTDNRAMLDAIADDPMNLRGVALVDDSFTEQDFARLHAGGIRAVRFHFTDHHPPTDMALFHRVVARIAGLGWHAQIHPVASEIAPLVPVLRALPIPFVIDHMGRVPAKDGVAQPAFRALLDLVRLPHGWVKVSGSERTDFPPYDGAVALARALVAAAPDRVVWGSDFPHPGSSHEFEDADLIDLIPRFAPDATTQRRILVDNPARLYGF
jgi:2-pyrone-4,6-dicarboxylate lactonase